MSVTSRPGHTIPALLAQMSLREKVDMLSGTDMFHTLAIPRLGIERLTLSDGPHGVRSSDAVHGKLIQKTTSFPTGISFAACWNTTLVAKVGVALGMESLAMGCDVLLGPCLNIHRTPLGGRNFESYAEDPYLAGRIGVAYVSGVQSTGTGACAKHFACNNQEMERWRGSSEVDERTLREIYLPAFEAVITEARPWTVMCSYNRINGVYGSQNHHLLTTILKGEWRFDGVVMSDWNAVHATSEPIIAGLDLEMPGPPKFFGRLLYEAAVFWQLEVAHIDAAVTRMLRLAQRCGRLPGARTKRRGAVSTPAHQKLARALCEEAVVLVKNDAQVLPFDYRSMRSLAVIGPQSSHLAVGGGSSWVDPPYRVTPLDGLRALCGKRIRLDIARGCDDHVDMPVVPTRSLIPRSGKGHGATVSYYNSPDCTGPVAGQAIDADISRWTWMQVPHPGVTDWRCWSAHFDFWYVPEDSGVHRIQLDVLGSAELTIDGTPRLAIAMPDPLVLSALFQKGFCELPLTKGTRYRCRIRFARILGTDDGTLVKFQAGLSPSVTTNDQDIHAAVAAAARCDAAVIFIGVPERFEGEECDRTHLRLPGRQDELVAAVVRANPRTAVVVQCGSPILMPWLAETPAVLLAWYPGMEGGHAIARTLMGLNNPSGKMPMTFPRRLEDTPAFAHYPGRRQARYGEGILVGYRHYDTRGVDPLVCFGHGLSYTSFTYSGLRLPKRAARGTPVIVRLTLRNSGPIAGAEVVQLYVTDQESSVVRPVRELKRFCKVALAPGERREVRFELDERAFAFYDTVRAQWVVEPGAFTIAIGSSSRDERLSGTLTLV